MKKFFLKLLGLWVPPNCSCGHPREEHFGFAVKQVCLHREIRNGVERLACNCLDYQPVVSAQSGGEGGK